MSDKKWRTWEVLGLLFVLAAAVAGIILRNVGGAKK